jgi:hypothetical protein
LERTVTLASRSVIASHAAGAASRSTIRVPPEAPSPSGTEKAIQ